MLEGLCRACKIMGMKLQHLQKTEWPSMFLFIGEKLGEYCEGQCTARGHMKQLSVGRGDSEYWEACV